MRRYLVMAAILACVSMSASVLGAEQTGGTTEESVAQPQTAGAKPSPVTVRIEGISAATTSDAPETTTATTTDTSSRTSNPTLKFNPKKEQ